MHELIDLSHHNDNSPAQHILLYSFSNCSPQNLRAILGQQVRFGEAAYGGLLDDSALLCSTVTPPHGDGMKRSNAKAKDSRKDTVIFSQEELRQDPGVYSVTVTSNAHVESDYTLDIQQARDFSAVRLHKDDEIALKKVKPCRILKIQGIR